jgi:hypothetical protein
VNARSSSAGQLIEQKASQLEALEQSSVAVLPTAFARNILSTDSLYLLMI